jgi:hypothetical protein
MAGVASMRLAEAVLAIHFLVIAFNLFGLIAIPLGAAFGRRFVRVRWWRWLHAASMGVVALQAIAGRMCFLTILQASLAGEAAKTPLIVGIVDRLIYWAVPFWVFEVAYVALFAYVIALFWLVPADQ